MGGECFKEHNKEKQWSGIKGGEIRIRQGQACHVCLSECASCVKENGAGEPKEDEWMRRLNNHRERHEEGLKTKECTSHKLSGSTSRRLCV